MKSVWQPVCCFSSEIKHRVVYVGEKHLLVKMPLAKDLLNPTLDFERRQHKKKRLVQSPNSYFMDVKCPVLCQPTGGKARLTEGCSFRRKH
ncbi:40S ribosomal protein S27-like isoform X2 [Hemibagrus wyckioides]|uniref:40S ribosomal protein S27-like isoform X2 n=1 Tax=Hemibagrus wyckioides TaxID=337641 RepID=UPI00266B9FE5|nr:40S ribosomal protein S27-like isoform X2 [Hemibagrus wyckioides]